MVVDLCHKFNLQYMKKLKNMNKYEQPREKARLFGVHSLTDVELLALLIRHGNKKKDVISLSKEVSEKLTLDSNDAQNFEFIESIEFLTDTHKYAILGALELGRRLFHQTELPHITSAKDVLTLLSYIAHKKQEHFIALYLNSRNQIIKQKLISVGTLDVSIAHPRDVYEPALKYSAASIILAHNHPSGDPEPSHADLLLTKRMYEAGTILGIRLLDHIIISPKKYISFKDSSYMPGS